MVTLSYFPILIGAKINPNLIQILPAIMDFLTCWFNIYMKMIYDKDFELRRKISIFDETNNRNM
jgi:hypothetical protein